MPDPSHVDIGGFRIERLHGEANWCEWSHRIEGVMVLSSELSLWDWVDGTKVMPTEDLVVWSLDQESGKHVRRTANAYELHLAIEAFRNGDRRATATLMHAIEYQTWLKVKWEVKRNLDSPARSSESTTAEPAKADPTAREIWLALKRIYDSHDSWNQVTLMKQMYTMKRGDNETPLELAYRLIKHTSRMTACGVKVEDAMVAQRIISMLQDSKEAQWLSIVSIQNDGSPTASNILGSLERSARLDESRALARAAEEEEEGRSAVQQAGQNRQVGRRQRERALAAGEQRQS